MAFALLVAVIAGLVALVLWSAISVPPRTWAQVQQERKDRDL
jgi:hypothetical protein